MTSGLLSGLVRCVVWFGLDVTRIHSLILQLLGWSGFVRVHGTPYSFLGMPEVPDVSFEKANQTAFSVCRSHYFPRPALIVHTHVHNFSSRPLRVSSISLLDL